MFAGIFKVDFNRDSTEIIAMKSSLGEYVKLESPVQVTEEVETWLNALSKEMVNSLKKVYSRVSSSSDLNIADNPSQISQLAEYVNFCQNAVGAIR